MFKLRSGEGRRSWTGFVVLVGGAFIAAFFFARTSDPVALDEATGKSMERAAAGRVVPTGAPGERPDDRALEQRAADLQQEIDGLERLAQAYEEELYGTPIPWPDGVEATVSADGFRAQVQAAVDDCGGGVELVGFDCSEPPCFALLRPGGEGWREALIEQCPAWHETYGTTTSGAGFTVECEDGSEETVEMVGIPASQVLGDDAGVEPGGLTKRLKARTTEQQLRWRCRGEGA